MNRKEHLSKRDYEKKSVLEMNNGSLKFLEDLKNKRNLTKSVNRS